MEPRESMDEARDRLEPALPRFAGLTPEEGRALAAELGVHLRLVEPGDMITMDYRTDRVTADLLDGRITRARVG